ncbi:hypothetical protein [Halalkalibacter nanhaiisediminis]|uniref:Phosphohistidine phosphatase n=1 Tax=Halalkalibacter nanhaiisediminis TaxID=688079 RepID=A0A562QRC9_9BACI|nr:hypothetical protein [Halalkalibacter nanhaiisediminis]TWI59233.1 hypothetical protein IQ10_00947 [Halalkalibacter nanhaiisediminis]
MKGPSRIIIFRHAEKPEFEKENGLNESGKLRAELLADLLIKKYPQMKAVYAAGSGPADLSERKIQTIIPLLIKVLLYINQALAINTVHLKFEVKDVAKEILTNPSFQSQTVLICWSHSYIPILADALGAINVPTVWPADRFDLIWEIDVYNHRLNQIPQLLLPGDSTTLIPVD